MASACRRKRSGAASQTLARSKKSKVRTRLASACTVCGLSSSTAPTTVSTWPRRALGAVGEAQHGDDQRDVGLDGGDDVGGGDVLLGDHREQPVARLGERGEGLERLEGQRQAAAVTLVLVALAGRRLGSVAPRRALAAAGRRALRVLEASRLQPSPACVVAPSLGSPAIRAGVVLLSRPYRQLCGPNSSTAHAGNRQPRAQPLCLRRAASAASMRRSVSSRPSSATLSKMPGEIVRAA